jgi:CRP/FNR family transcriptional regulator
METEKQHLAFLSNDLREQLIKYSSIQVFSKGTEILRDEQYVKVLPIVLKGLVKVFSKFDERELLLYYIQPNESCVMSFSAALKNTPSKVFAITEEESEILLLPVEHLPKWLREYPDLNQLFYNQYDLRYTELLDTIQHVLINKMDKRLFDYLYQKAELTHFSPLKITHSQIANELGTAREVISRVMKKLEREGKVSQGGLGIEIIRR